MRSAVIPMSTSEVRSIWLKIDAIGCGIVLKSTSGVWPRIADGRRSGAELGDSRLVGESGGHQGAQPLADRGIVVEDGQPPEQEELLHRLAVPAAIEIELGKQ